MLTACAVLFLIVVVMWGVGSSCNKEGICTLLQFERPVSRGLVWHKIVHIGKRRPSAVILVLLYVVSVVLRHSVSPS